MSNESFLEYIRICNGYDPSHFLPFRVDGVAVGQVKPRFARALRQWPKVFKVSDSAIDLAPGLDSFKCRTEAVAVVLEGLVRQGVLGHLHGEQYVVTPSTREQGFFLIDRAAAPCFGIRAFGQHLNGFVREGDEVRMWIGRRSADRRNHPGKLDNLAAGGLPYGISLRDNLAKECWEEAGISPELAARAWPAGAITYNSETSEGFKPDTLYCYDLELPSDFAPSCNDGEMEMFYLWPMEQVMERLRESGEFKPNCGLVIVDFMIRHGFIGPDDDDYLQLIQGLHAPVGAPFAVIDPG